MQAGHLRGDLRGRLVTRPSLAGIEQRAEVFRLHVPVSRCDTWEHGSSCPGVERCKNCRRRWPCTFITDAEAAFTADARTVVPALLTGFTHPADTD